MTPLVGIALRGLGAKVVGRTSAKAIASKFAKQGAGKLVKEWPARSKALRRKLAHRSAEMTLEMVKDKVPKKDAWADYRRSLQLSVVTANPKDGDAFMVRSSPKVRKVQNVDASDTLLYVRSHKRLKKVPTKIRILEKYSPWTLHTLPFTPERSDAVVVSRKVSKREALKVTDRLLRLKHKWRTELSREGVRPMPVRSEEVKAVATVPDVAFEAIRLEFGIGQKPVAHWRPAVSRVAREGARGMMRDPEMSAALSNPNFTGWKRWGKISANKKTSVSEAQKMVPFQKKLGVSVGK